MVARIILTVLGLALVVLLFFLPKIVVNNEDDALVDANKEQADSEEFEGNHSLEVSTETIAEISRLRQKLNVAKSNEKSATFADSLAMQFLGVNQFDSAFKYVDKLLKLQPGHRAYLAAGDAYYQAHGFAIDAPKREKLGQKAREYYNKILEIDANDLSVKNKVAMTYVSGESPMQGILMLREVISADPENEEALFNLGVLSIQSGQFEKAKQRLEKLISIYPNNVEAHYFLGYSHMQLGETDQARKKFEFVKTLDADPAVMAAVESYLNEIK